MLVVADRHPPLGAALPVHHRYVLATHPEDLDVTAAALWTAGALGIWERPGEVVAWFSTTAAPVPPGGTWTAEPDRDWQAEWKATVEPVLAGRFAVVPTWRIADHTPRPGETTLVLDPGRAFGSGHHATTALCLEALDQLELRGRTVADIGCGSGVLAIAAAARGARVVATDVDPDAVEVAADNARRNGVEVMCAVGSVAAAVALLDGPADVVVANLVTDTVVALAGELVGACDPDHGTLLVSGIAAERGPRAAEALNDAGWVLAETTERDGWVALRGQPSHDRGVGVASDAVGG